MVTSCSEFIKMPWKSKSLDKFCNKETCVSLTESSPNSFDHGCIFCLFLFGTTINFQSNFPNIFCKTLRSSMLVMLWTLRSWEPYDELWTTNKVVSFEPVALFFKCFSLMTAEAKCAGRGDHSNAIGDPYNTEALWECKTFFFLSSSQWYT